MGRGYGGGSFGVGVGLMNRAAVGEKSRAGERVRDTHGLIIHGSI